MTDTFVPAEVFPPGEFIRDELEARGWIQEDLAAILNCSPRLVSEIVSGKRSVTPNTARGLAQAFGTSAQVWMNLESAYQLHRLEEANASDDAVAARSLLFDKAPVREMINRGWLQKSDNPTVLKQQLLQFFDIKTLDDQPQVWSHAARKSTCYDRITPSQFAWLCRCRELSRAVSVGRFTAAKFDRAIASLQECLVHPFETRHAPKILAEAGIRLVIVQHLKATRIDGATMWLNKQSPVIALSLRYDRIDCFWFTLFHELYHVRNRDGLTVAEECPLDVRLVGTDRMPSSDKSENEQNADSFSERSLVDQGELEDFIARTGPAYSKRAIRGFSDRIKIHPGIVVGQLQHRDEIAWTHSREMLVKVRGIVTESTLTDGWGFDAPPTGRQESSS
jgi:HTH-type transcriptional regulator/antitoxin HigA